VRSSEILDSLVDIEKRHPVADWRIAGVRVWPLVRVWLYNDLFNSAVLQDAAPSSTSRHMTRVQRLIRARLRVATASWRDRKANAQLGSPADAVFYSDGVSFVKVEGVWYDKLFDPIIGWLRQRDARFLLLTPMTEAHHPRRSASRFIQPRLDAIKVCAALRRGVAGEVNLPGFDAQLSGTRMNAALLFRLWNRLTALSDYFERVLSAAAPVRAFVNTYYSIEGMAFVLACRRLRVPVADLQHGLQGDHHVAYGRWLNLPNNGYELLPDEFWVWGELERRAIDDWTPYRRTYHQPVITGNAWLELWRSESDPFVHHAVSEARRMRRADARRCVLVTLQWGLPEEETLKLLRAIRMAPDDIQWWLRLHPLVAHDRRPIRSLIEQYGLRNVQIDGPTDLPLHALLKIIDVHVTHSSSTVIEACEFAVPSVVTSQDGAQFFQEQIAAGVATVATTDHEIVAAVNALGTGTNVHSTPLSARGCLEQALFRAFPDLCARHERVLP